jgi:hypothetical protein
VTPPTARIRDLGPTDRLGFPARTGWLRAETLVPLASATDGGALETATTVRIGRLPAALCARFECRGVPPCTLFRRGAALWEESVVEAFLAGGAATPKAYLEIEVNPAGAIFDAVVSNPNGERETMRILRRGVPGTVARVGREGPDLWTVELSISWSALPGAEALAAGLRANFFRIDRAPGRNPEHGAWSPTFVAPPDFHKPERFGYLIHG